jgi:hypothetical protein
MKTLGRSKDRIVRVFDCDGGGYVVSEKVRVEEGRNKWHESRVFLDQKEIAKLRGLTPEEPR